MKTMLDEKLLPFVFCGEGEKKIFCVDEIFDIDQMFSTLKSKTDREPELQLRVKFHVNFISKKFLFTSKIYSYF